MKKITLLILLFTFNLIIAQTKGRIRYRAFFSKSEATEELRAVNVLRYQEYLDEEMMAKMLIYNLDFNKSKSLFYLSKNLISEHEDQERKKYVTALFYGFDKIYIDKKEDKLIEELYYSYQNLLKVRKANFINWKLTEETKEIKGYKCFKATYTYIQKWRGREFPWEIIAWYSPEIPVKLGPIRYGGLPGLILELSEDNRGFIVDEIKFLNDEELEIKEPTKGELILEDEIK
ncbi:MULTISPECIES: GLPGLI family protein [unclassified Tenacibaculum]|uniref:GLPGLI family protein n=1 Tax=unclassified Tenacibaculum TaxID=2635139 RepID=UPI001F2E7795|nr:MULTISPECIES: GLPGLI family protein [unclassified Tenacibaculum]MCF2873635.1 GLPGLI family protein [Tenacibaculum sp. Cn5-1]MCF2933791.1 GLPGLI family protein [Tenacibaculum sp. Cn5-34]MCG7509627.1 GLPGLI family protein [Tenacibaculum sp. Cn5-46]